MNNNTLFTTVELIILLINDFCFVMMRIITNRVRVSSQLQKVFTKHNKQIQRSQNNGADRFNSEGKRSRLKKTRERKKERTEALKYIITISHNFVAELFLRESSLDQKQ